MFVYRKQDSQRSRMARLHVEHVVFIDQRKTADFQTTSALLAIVKNNGNADDLMACIQDRNLPVDEIEARNLAQEILKNPPELGYLTISNALQWRLQYSRIIEKSGEVPGIDRLLRRRSA